MSNQKSQKRKEILRTLKYAMIAISAGAIQLISFLILNELIVLDKYVPLSFDKVPALKAIFVDEYGKTYGLSYFISLVLSVIWNFTFNRKFTFKSANNVAIAMLKVLGYYLVFTPLSCWWTVQLNSKWRWTVGSMVLSVYVIQIATMLVNGITEFLFQRFVVFGKTIDSSVKGKEEEDANSDENPIAEDSAKIIIEDTTLEDEDNLVKEETSDDSTKEEEVKGDIV